VLVPGVRHGIRVPRSLVPILLGACAVIATVVTWAVVAPRPTGTDIALPGSSPSTDIRAVAYSTPGDDGLDHIYVRDAAPAASPRLVASIPHAPGIHLRGSASPIGDRLAILSVTSGTYASLAAVDLPSGQASTVPGTFDYLSPLVWSPDGKRVVVVQTETDSGTSVARVMEADIQDRSVRTIAEFRDAFAVAPVGFSVDGERTFIVVVDETGSNLWERRDGELKRLAELSPGRTRDWALSPGGSRLAFIDVLGTGSRTYIGRMLTIATGAISTQPSEGDQFGAAWQPSSPMPVFGGPGGALAMEDPGTEGAYVVPLDWAPTGEAWVATVIIPGTDRTIRATEVIELQTRSTREQVAVTPGSAFLGWVSDLDY